MHYITARGDSLDFDELIRKNTRQKKNVDMKDKIVLQKIPQAGEKMILNVRGFRPTATTVTAKVVTPEVEHAPVPVVEEPLPMSEHTKLRIDSPKRLKKKVDDIMASTNETLGEILSELQPRSGGDPGVDWETEKTRKK